MKFTKDSALRVSPYSETALFTALPRLCISSPMPRTVAHPSEAKTSKSNDQKRNFFFFIFTSPHDKEQQARGKQPLGEQASQIVTNFVFAFQGCFDMRQELLKLAWVNPVFMAEPSNRADRRRTQRDGHVASSGGDRPQYKTIIISAVVP